MNWKIALVMLILILTGRPAATLGGECLRHCCRTPISRELENGRGWGLPVL